MKRRRARGAWRLVSFVSTTMGMVAYSPMAAQTSADVPSAAKLLAGPSAPIAHYSEAEKALRLIDAKQWAEAEVVLRQIASEYPFGTASTVQRSTWGRLGIALRQQGKHREAIEAYRKVIELQGAGLPYAGAGNARYWIAVSQLALGDTEAALASLDILVNDEGFLNRSELAADANFAALKRDPRLLKIAGKVDIPGLSRDEGWRRDIDYLVAELRRTNPSNSPIPTAFFERAAALRTAVPSFTDAQVVFGISSAMAALERGHTGLWLGAPGTRAGLDFRPMPIRLHAFPEGVFITEAWGEAEGLAGAQVLRFGRVSATHAMTQLAAATSRESPMETFFALPRLLNRPAFLNGMGATTRTDRAELGLRLRDGRTVTRVIAVDDEPPPEQWRRKLNAPPGVPAPLLFRNLREAHWLQALPEHKAVYIQVNNMVDDPDESLADFGLKARQEIETAKARNVVIDLRHNNGGNSFQYTELLRTLTGFSAREGNIVYALVGRGIYSAAANFTTDLERIVRPIFVGEPSSATGNQWGDEAGFSLPYSGLRGSFSGARWQLSHPWDERRSISPQVPVQLTAAAYFKGRDPALEVVFDMIGIAGADR